MAPFGAVRAVRDCDWLDAGRARAYARILLVVTLAGAIGWIALSTGGLDRQGKPIGADFVGFYTASRLALDGRADLAYDVGAHWAAQKALFGPEARLYRVLLPAARAPDLFAARARALFLGSRGLACGDRFRLLPRPARLLAIARAGGVPRLSRCVRERRARTERFSERGVDRRRPPPDGPETCARRRLFRRHGVQAASGAGHPVRARLRPSMDHPDRRSGRRRRVLPRLARRRSAPRRGAASSPTLRSPARRWRTISSATRRCRAYSPPSGCCMARSRSPGERRA